jgi:hypothetical protein
MPQHLADRWQRNADADHLARDRVPQTMRPNSRHPRAGARATDDRGDPATPECADRRSCSQEQLPPPALRPTPLQITRDRFPHIGGQRQPILPAALEARFTLHHVRRRLPAEVRVVASDHPLTGRVLRARHVYRRWGRRWVVLELPDGGVVSVEVEDTDVLEAEPVVRAPRGSTMLSREGARRLLGLLEVCMERVSVGAVADRRMEGERDDV